MSHTRVASVHKTDRHGQGLRNTTAVSADDLSPSKDEDMLQFLLHKYMLIRTVGDQALRYFWPITFDEDTYTRSRKIIFFVCVIAPACGEFDTMSLPDFGIFLLVPELWHVSYVMLRHLTHGPKLAKGHDEDDNKRFMYRNFNKPMLTIMRKRGSLEDDLAASLTDMGIPVEENDKVINVNKEKMGAEYRDCHLFLTYQRIAFSRYKREYTAEYDMARKAADKDNLDVRAIFDLFESRMPACLDFSEHTHYNNVSVLEYMLARIAVALDTEGRTGYRRVLLQFLNDLEKVSSNLRKLLLHNMNSLSAVDIELIHGMLSSVIATTHRKRTEQEAINTACREFPVLKIANLHNACYHRSGRVFGYSVSDKLPVNASKYVDVCLDILRANIKKCMRNRVTADAIEKGKPGTKALSEKSKSLYKRVVSKNLGEYPKAYVDTCVTTRIDSLLRALFVADSKMRKYDHPDNAKGFASMHAKLHDYCTLSEGDTVFPFANESVFGLSVSKMQSVFKSI